jgi:hypothetical protein
MAEAEEAPVVRRRAKARGGVDVGKAHEENMAALAGAAAGCTRFRAAFASKPSVKFEDLMAAAPAFRAGDDAFFVLDGHGGTETAAFVGKQLAGSLAEALAAAPQDPPSALEAAFKACNELGRAASTKGGCAGTAIVTVGGQLFAANVGDCRAVLCRNGAAVRLTVDHRATDPAEEARIKGLGGFVQGACPHAPALIQLNLPSFVLHQVAGLWV